jgi:hypothetical protein
MRKFLRRFYRDSIPSPQNKRRGCLCKNNTYHVDCCDGEFRSQGVGATQVSIVTEHILLEDGGVLLHETGDNLRQ